MDRENVRTIGRISYKIIRSRRKSVAATVGSDGIVLVKAPLRYPNYLIENFLDAHEAWILRQVEKVLKLRSQGHVITEEERKQGKKLAHKIFPERTAYFAERMGVTYQRITIREQKTRWGSCSSQGNLNFNWKLVLMPPEVLDYVVVHELAHRKEMNHSSRFWRIVETELPDYRQRQKLLKECGARLLSE